MADMLATKPEPTADIEALQQAVIDELVGDYLYCLLQESDRQQSIPPNLKELLKVLVDLIVAAPMGEEFARVMPKVVDCASMLRGLHALSCPEPTSLTGTCTDDVNYLLPFCGRMLGEVAKSGVRSGPAIARLLRSSTFWKSLHGEFVRHMGSQETIGEELHTLILLMQTQAKKISNKVGDDDIHAQTAQESSAASLEGHFENFMSCLPRFKEGVRPGGLDGVFNTIREVLGTFQKYCDECGDVPPSRWKVIRELAQVFGDTALAQCVSDKLMHQLESSATERLDCLLGKAHNFAFDDIIALHKAVKDTTNIKLPETMHEKLFAVLYRLLTLARKGAQMPIDAEERKSIQPALSFLRDLSTDPRVLKSSTSGEDKDRADIVAFVQVVEVLLSAQETNAKLIAGIEDDTSVKEAFDKLAKKVHTLLRFTRRRPTWTGVILEEGDALLEYAESYLKDILVKLDQRGSEDICARVDALEAATSKLDKFAGGCSDGSGKVWTSELPKNASKEAILLDFDTHLKDIDAEVVEGLALEVVKVRFGKRGLSEFDVPWKYRTAFASRR